MLFPCVMPTQSSLENWEKQKKSDKICGGGDIFYHQKLVLLFR